MKKFVSFCVAAAVVASAVPAMAQCTSCGGGAPVFSQPVMNSYVPQATYSAPMMSQQVYSQPAYSQPVYNQPAYSQPVYNQPQAYSAPVMSQPVYGSSVMSSPVVSSGCSGCGGGQIISGGIVDGGQVISGGIVDGGMVSGGIVDGGIVNGGEVIVGGGVSGGQIISWEGGSEIQGTIVSDVLLEGGEEASTELTEGENAVDVVEPPAAADDSPGPDTGEETTEGET